MILLYHSIVPDDSPPERWMAGRALTRTAFERQIVWLSDHYPIVSLTDYIDSLKQPKYAKHKIIAITFDDGFDITFQCAFPILFERKIPAAIFISTGHIEKGELLWFSYLKALCFDCKYTVVEVDHHTYSLQTQKLREHARGQLRLLAKTSGSPSNFCRNLSQRYPLDLNMKPCYAGMTHKQIKIASESGILELGAHTMTHPFLSQLSRHEQEEEILGSRNILSELTNKEILYFAYPGGEYNHDTLELMKSAGFKAAFAVIPQKTGLESMFEIGRIGIYSESLVKLQLKTMGVADLARLFGLKVG